VTLPESELLEALGQSVRRFARDRIDAQAIDREGRIPAPLLEGLAELGLFGLSIPERWGGAGFSLGGVCGAVETLARFDRSVATTVGLHLGLGTRGLVAFGSDWLRGRYLPDLASGRTLAAFAATEPGAGSDLSAIATRAVQIARGRLRVDGSKIFVTNGGIARIFTIAAATPGLGGARRGHSLILLERGDVGLRAQGEERKLGLRGCSTTSLHLERVEVPGTRIIGEPGRGMELMGRVLSWGRTLMAAGCTGAARTAMDAAVAHVSGRRQFGRALSAFEVVRAQIAQMAAVQFAMESLVAATCAAEDRPDELAVRSRAAKIFCSEGDWEICDLALQLHGGTGFIEDSGLPLLLRDARITRIFEGANDVLIVAHGVARGEPRMPLDGSQGLQAAAAGAERLAAAVASARDELHARFGVRLVAQQRLLHRLGRLLVLRDSADAAVLHAGALATDEARALATHWVELAWSRAAPFLETPPGSAEAVAGRVLAR
jgi:alkylation response protein AidB-like acyl-CoA dehydrogenase